MSWYVADDKRRNTRQVVLELPAGGAQVSKFGSLGLAAKYESLLTSTWCAGYFRTDAEKGPFLLVRADRHVDRLRECALRVAFAFYREPAGGLFGIFVAADNPDLAKASPTGHAVFECCYGLDFHDATELLEEGLSRDTLHLCFAGASINLRMSMLDASGESREIVPPACQFDRVFPVTEDCRRALNQEFRDLIAFHRALPPSKRDYPLSMQQLTEDFPATEHPVLRRAKGIPSIQKAVPQPTLWKRLFGGSQTPPPPPQPTAKVLPFDDLRHVVLYAKGNIESFSPSDEMQRVLEEMTGRSIQEVIRKAQFQLFRNSGDTLDLAKKGSVAIIAATELGLSLGDQELPKRFIGGEIKASERYFRDSGTGHDFVIVLLYGSDA